MTLPYLIQKEFLQLRRNPFLPRLILMFPIVIMCVMPWVTNMEIKNVAVCVVDNDRSTLSAELVHRIEASRYFVFKGLKASHDEAMASVERSEADVALEIPRNYERSLRRGEPSQVLVAANAVNGTKGSMGGSYVSSTIVQHLSEYQAHLLGGKCSTDEAVNVLYLYNKCLNYKLFMIPSLTTIILLLLCGFLPALNIVGEKERGTIEAMNVTPVGKLTFILSKLLPYWLMAFVVITECLLLARLVYGMSSAGPVWIIYLLSALLALLFSALGLIISNYNETMQQAVFVMWFTVVLLILLSGLFTPVRSMPDWAYRISLANPVCHFIDAVRNVFIRGGDASTVVRQIGVLLLYAAGLTAWAVLSYRKNQ